MGKQIIRRYTFNPLARTLTFTDFDTAIDLSRLALVTNLATNTILYNFVDPAYGASVSGNVLTLEYDTTTMSASDPIRIDYDTVYDDPSYDKVTVGNQRTKFRDGFANPNIAQPDATMWTLSEDTPGKHIITQGGNSSGSSYLRISMDPFIENDGLRLTSKQIFRFPMRASFGVSASQRVLGQEFFVGVVGLDANGNVDYGSSAADKPITGSTISVTSNVGTVTLTNHGLTGGDRVSIFGCADHRMNVAAVAVTVVDANTFTYPVTIANASYSSTGGTVRLVDPLRNAKNAAGLLFENTNVANASFVARRNGAKFRSLNSTTASTTATQTNTSGYTDSFNSTGNQELYFNTDEVLYRSFPSDSNSGVSGSGKYSQGIPDEELDYKLHIRVRNLNGLTKPTARVVSATKSGSTTATVVTDVAHGLATGDFVQIYGTRDQTNFAQLSTQTAIASVVDATTFTVVWGSSVTASTAGGVVWANQGQVSIPGIIGQSVQSISRTSNILTVVGSATWSGPLPGEYFQLHGLETAALPYEGAYKVLRISGSNLELASTGPDFGSITTGGAVFRRTDIRLHFARVMDYTRLGVEVLGGRGTTTDGNSAAPVSVTSAPTLAVSQSSASTTVTWTAAGPGGVLAADVASAAITTTTTTSAVTPGLNANIGTFAHSFNVIVTAVSGTTPTLDVGVEESLDNGTNWVRIYDFPRITATGAYTSPLIRAQYGTRYRYVQTVAGTSPSFTRAVNRVMFSSPGQLFRQFFDRSISLTTLNSTTPAYLVDGCNKFMLGINIGAATTPPQLQLEGSEDNSSWYSLGSVLVSVASSTVVAHTNDVLPKYVRARISTQGASVTAGYVTIKALGTQ